MEPGHWINLAAICSATLTAAGTTIATIWAGDRQRRREREAAREQDESARVREREQRREQERRNFIESLMPLVSLLADFPPGRDANDEDVRAHVSRLRSERVGQALEAATLIGLIYPSPQAQVAAGYVSQSINNVVLVEEAALEAKSVDERSRLLGIAADHYRECEAEIRELVRELRGPLPWESGLGKGADDYAKARQSDT